MGRTVQRQSLSASRNTKIQQYGITAAFGHVDIGWLDILVNNTLLRG